MQQLEKPRQGYKLVKSFFGNYEEIPENWLASKLIEMLDILKDGTHILPTRVDYGIPILSSEDIHDGIIDFEKDVAFITKEDYEKLHAKYKISKNDILMTIVGTLGRVSQVTFEKEFTVQRSVAIFRPNFKILSDFLYYLIQTHYFQKQLEVRKNATAQSGVYLGELAKIQIFYPINKLEQQKITSILSNVDSLINQTQKIIEQTQRLKKGLMQKLLTKGIGHNRFKKIKWLFGKTIEIPEDWSIKKLNEVAEITRLAGYEYSKYWKSDPNGKIIALRGFNIQENELDLTSIERISEELSNILIRSKLFIGDVVFPCVGSIGNAALITEDNRYHINQNIAKITPKHNLDSLFLTFFLLSDITKKQIFNFSASTTQPNVLVNNLRKFVIPIPTLVEQQKIALVISNIILQIQKQQDYKSKLETLKKGLMQKLLTGQIRVSV